SRVLVCFFFSGRRRHTSFSRDWSSDVCSSDLPDIYANAGGVTVSYFEWVQALQSFSWTEDEVNSRLQRIMIESFMAIHEAAEQYHVPLRTAALVRAIQRVAEISRARAFCP